MGRKASGPAMMGSGVAQPEDKLNNQAHSFVRRMGFFFFRHLNHLGLILTRGDAIKRLFAIIISSLLILFGFTTPLLAEQNEHAYLNNEIVAYYPFNGNANDEIGNGNDGTVYIEILKEDIFGSANSAYAGSRDVSEKWNYSGGNIIEVKFKSGKVWWSFLPARHMPVR